ARPRRHHRHRHADRRRRPLRSAEMAGSGRRDRGRGRRHRRAAQRRGGRGEEAMSAMSPEQVASAAAALDQAEKTRRQIGILSLAHAGMDMDDAYAVQGEWVRQKLAAGRRKVGWKIGLTSKAMQYALNIDIPDSGVLLDD